MLAKHEEGNEWPYAMQIPMDNIFRMDCQFYKLMAPRIIANGLRYIKPEHT